MPTLSGEEFVALLGDLGEGSFLDTAGIELAEVLDAVNQTGKKGRLQLTIGVERIDDGAPYFAFVGQVKAARPAADMAAVRFWSGDHLHRHHPAQMTLGDAIKEGVMDPHLPQGFHVDHDTGEIHVQESELEGSDDAE